jgi:DNA repair protein RAD51
MPEPRKSKDGPITLRKALELDSTRTTFSSGSDTIDGLLGGGFRTGELVEVFGASNTGKTQLAMQSAISVASKGFACAFIDTEGQFRPERLASICINRGVDPSKVLPAVYSVRAESTRRQTEAISSLARDNALGNCKMVVVDTLTKNFTLEHAGARMVGKRQAALSVYLNTLSRDAYLHDRAVVLLNRVASVVTDGNDREVDIGGETVRHYAQRVLHLRRSGTFVMASRPDERGEEVRTRITDLGLV